MSANRLKDTKGKMPFGVKQYHELNACSTPSSLNKFIDEYGNSITDVGWHLISKSAGLDDTTMTYYQDYIDWDYILVFRSLKMSMINKHLDRLNWFCLSRYQALTDSFIKKNIKYLNIPALIVNSKITFPRDDLEKLREKFKHKEDIWYDEKYYAPITGRVRERVIFDNWSKDAVKDYLRTHKIPFLYKDTLTILKEKANAHQDTMFPPVEEVIEEEVIPVRFNFNNMLKKEVIGYLELHKIDYDEKLTLPNLRKIGEKHNMESIKKYVKSKQEEKVDFSKMSKGELKSYLNSKNKKYLYKHTIAELIKIAEED